MGMVVRSNIMALNANRQLGMNNSSVSKNLEKLSSGFRINRAGDDASGLAISEKMKAQIKGLETASMNSQDGISLVQTAEGALTEVHDMLNRMVELAEKSANGTMEIGTGYGAAGTDRQALQDEMDQLATEIDRIADSTNFNNIKLLDGSLGGVSIKKTGAASGGTAPGITVSGFDAGSPTTKATFTMAFTDDMLRDGATFTVGGKNFKVNGTATDLAAAEDGTKENPYTISITGQDKATALGSIKDKLNTVFSSANKIGGQNFNVTVEGSNIKFEATVAGELKDGEKTLTQADLGITSTPVSAPTTPPVTGSTTVAVDGTTTAGVEASAAVKAVYTWSPTDATQKLADDTTLDINGTYFKVASGSSGDGTEGSPWTISGDTLEAQLTAIAGKLGDSDWAVAGTATSITFTANTAGALGSTGAPASAPTAGAGGSIAQTTEGKDEVTEVKGSVSFKFTKSEIKDGTQFTIGDNKYQVKFKNGTDVDAGIKTIDLTSKVAGEQTDTEFLTALKTALETGDAANFGADSGTYVVSTASDKLTLTQRAAADKSVEDLNNLVKGEDPAPATASATPALAAAAPAADAPATNNGKAVISFMSQPKAGSTITIGSGDTAKTYEFVKADGDATKTTGATAITIGADKDATLKALSDKMVADGLITAGDYDAANKTITLNSNDANAPQITSKGGGLTLQIGDTNDSYNKMDVAIQDMHMESLFDTAATKDGNGDAILQTLDNGTKTIDISSQDTAGAALTAIKKVINTVSSQRAKLGATQNRLEHTINNLDVAAENMNAANSRIRDTDMAKQMMEYTKMNVLTQAAQAMLAQANQQPQSILQLLQ